MAQIKAENLTFSYEGSADTILDNVSFCIDTNWKLGLIGRNGKGKTTLLNLLLGRYEYTGSITSGTRFDYFPYRYNEEDLKINPAILIETWKPHVEMWQVMVQMNQIGMDSECLYRPLDTLSHGERTRVMLAVLFSDENDFLLIDEPTNHLDSAARSIVKDYLASKKGFILVSHDRDLLDAVCDHMLVLNRCSIEVQTGNFSTWWENKKRADDFARAENAKHINEIEKLRGAIYRSSRWAAKSENSKIGFDPVKETDRNISSRSHIGGKTKKMQARVKSYEVRVGREIEEKEGLLRDIETVEDLKIMPLVFHKEVLIDARDLSLRYEGSKALFEKVAFCVNRFDRTVIRGGNGCGKSSLIKAILNSLSERGDSDHGSPLIGGTLKVASNLTVSVVDQDTSFLKGGIDDFCTMRGLDRSLFLTLLRKLDLGREQFVKNIEDLSEGQKKKILIAASLMTPAHLYIWDEPLNYIDVFSRMQIEKLILDHKPTMLIVEHDERFRERIATKYIDL